MTPPPLRALAIDIDGTLINSAKRIPEFTRSEIQRVVAEYGTRLILITARSPQSTAIIEERLGVRASFATFGGSMVWARGASDVFEVLSETPLGNETVVEFLRLAAAHDVHAGIYSRETWFVNSLNYWGLREARNTAVWPKLVDLQQVAGDDQHGPFFKVMFRGEREPLARLAEELQALETPTFIHHIKHVLEIVPAAAVKLPALDMLLQHFGLKWDEVISFGDSESDVEMLEHSGVGVLMGNASPGLAVGDHVERGLSHDEDGVGISLRKYFPSKAPFLP